MDLKKYYQDYGYCVFKSLIPQNNIDKLLSCFEILKSSHKKFFSQSEHNWRRISDDIDQYGLLNTSFLNFTDLPWANTFGNFGREILLSSTICDAIKSLLPGFEEFYMRQNMFFDKSTNTVDHIDSWYLDTDPLGSLIAVWIALEDIDGDGGSFHVYPGSHKDKSLKSSHWQNLSHDEFIQWSKNLGKKYKKKSLKLKKGDALFWHPFLLHGSSAQKIDGLSRKSITAHYQPMNLRRTSFGKEISISSKEYKNSVIKNKNNFRKYKNTPIFALKRRVFYKASLIGLIKYYLNLSNRSNMLMNASKIKNLKK